MNMQVETRAVAALTDAEKIRMLIAKARKHRLTETTVAVTCLDERDAEQINQELTLEEQKHVSYTMLGQ
jgi:hypothetical protein